MKKYAVIVAGGTGVRMGGTVPKQLILLHGKPVLWYTLNVFLEAFDDLEIILVLPSEHMEAGREIVRDLGGDASGADGKDVSQRIHLVSGGDTRFHSVRNGLELVKEKDSIVFVHDGVRCLLSGELVRRCYEQALQLGSAIPVIDCRDSVRLTEEGGRSKPIDRSRIKMVQTPQTFKGEIILSAYTRDQQESFTDEATVVEESGQEVYLIAGEADNIKLTLPGDIVYASFVLAERMGKQGADGAISVT